MSKNIDPLKKQKVKTALKKGESAKQALITAGYTEATAEHSTSLSVVKCSQEEIAQELRAEDITPTLVIKRINEDREIAKKKNDPSTMARCDELLGRFIIMFGDKKVIDAKVMTDEDQAIIDRYTGKASNGNRLQHN